MKSAFRPILPVLALLLLLGACGRDNPTLDAPTGTPDEISVEITSPENGARIGGNVVRLEVEAEGIAITEPDGDVSGDTGHFHVFVDRDPVAVGETISDGPGVFHFSEDSIYIPGLAVGKHKLTVVLGDGSETRLSRASDVVEVEVTGPSIDASAPETAPMAVGFTVDTLVTGVQIVDPAGATGQPGTGHLDLVIDPQNDPIGGGQAFPFDSTHIHTTGTSAEVTGLPAGEHTIWVVLTDQNHVPVDPPVADKVVVTVR
jgi:hypothetical protein